MASCLVKHQASFLDLMQKVCALRLLLTVRRRFDSTHSVSHLVFAVLLHTNAPAPWTFFGVSCTLVCLCLYPTLVLFPFFLPAPLLASLGILACIVRSSPFGIAKRAAVSLRWEGMTFAQPLVSLSGQV